MLKLFPDEDLYSANTDALAAQEDIDADSK